MTSRLALLAFSLVPILPAAGLADYRGFRLGMSVADVAKESGIAASAVHVISNRPPRIEELDWRINWMPTSQLRNEPFSQVAFSFCDNQLFEIAIAYDRDQIAGMTDSDMVEAIAAVYGPPASTAASEVTLHSGFTKTVAAVARWEDAQSVVSLIRLPYDGGFGLVLSSKSGVALADTAILESERIDRAEAPERERAAKLKQADEARAIEEKNRTASKAGFRP